MPITPSADNGSGPPASQRFETSAADHAEAAIARRSIAALVEQWGCGSVDDVALVVSELVANAIMHAGCAVLVVVGCADDGRHVLIEVHDQAPALPRVRDLHRGPGGLGLRIVDQVAEQWGASATATGKSVWALVST